MFWLKEYCKKFSLTIVGNKILEGEKEIGKINMYDEIVYFKNNNKFKFGDISHLILENMPAHKEE